MSVAMVSSIPPGRSSESLLLPWSFRVSGRTGKLPAHDSCTDSPPRLGTGHRCLAPQESSLGGAMEACVKQNPPPPRPAPKVACPRILCHCALATLLFLVGASSAAGQAVKFSPTSLSFGSVAVNRTSAAKTLEIINNQSIVLTISSITATGDYHVQADNCPLAPGTLGAGKNCTLSLVFTPTQTGTRTGTLLVTDNGAGSPQSVPLSGNGTAPVTVAPGNLSFGNVDDGGSSTPKTVTLTNLQPVSLQISIIVGTPDYQGHATTCPVSPAVLSGGASCTVSVVSRRPRGARAPARLPSMTTPSTRLKPSP